MAHVFLTYIRDSCVKIYLRAAVFLEILEFKVKSTKIKVNNENVSDVNIDERIDNAVSTERKRQMKHVSKSFDFRAIQ